jgi:hypothetical protein
MSEFNTTTTSINDLPTDPTNGGTIGGNISLTANEIPSQNQNQGLPSQLSLDQSTISQIVNGLQQASLAGATSLPSRDIPINTEQLTKDVYIQPNYVPQPVLRDYINETDEDINRYYKQENVKNSLDSIYDEIQTPLLLAIMYFLFQLPIFKKTIFKYLSFLCHSDGNYNINGLLFISALFGFIYYILSKTVKQFNKF